MEEAQNGIEVTTIEKEISGGSYFTTKRSIIWTKKEVTTIAIINKRSKN
jgi:hypothetical protein